MNLREALHNARSIVIEHGIEDASLESEVLLRYLLDIDRTFLYTNPEQEISPDDYEKFMELVTRRCSGEPTAYITGIREFYDREFSVNPSVLIPRPETELLVETAIKLAGTHGYRSIADIGTGSGCIAVSLVLELPDAEIYATDISSAALKVAVENSRKHNVENRITFLSGNLLEPLTGDVDMIVANLPYVDEKGMERVNTLGFEPESALNGGNDGLRVIDAFIRQAKTKLRRRGALLLEIGQAQHTACVKILEVTFPGGNVSILKDLAGVERVIGVVMS